MLPPVEAVEQAIVARDNQESLFEATLAVMETLKEHAEKSDLVKEIFENTKMDVHHGLNPRKFPWHEGRFYINSVTD